MEQAARIRSLQKRNETFNSRVVIPTALVPKFGCREILKSLRTKNRLEAIALHRKEEIDRQLTIRALRMTREVMTARPMVPLGLTEDGPSAQALSDDELLDYARQTGETTYHPVGTCKMGVDSMSVVNPRLCVHGIAGLRVADASIMPMITSGNTNAPSIMIGERASDFVLEDALVEQSNLGVSA